MDAECSQLLPQVCAVLLDSRQLVTDDSIYEKLLDWFKCLLDAVPPEVLLEENPCIVGLLQQAVTIKDPDPGFLAFSMRLSGMLAAQDGGFKYLQDNHVIQEMFGEHVFYGVTWQDASIRRAWIKGLLCMVQHKQPLHFLQHAGLTEMMLSLLMDSSLFVASAANDLAAHVFQMSVTLEGQTGNGIVSDLPALAQTIFRHLEMLLLSAAPQPVTQSLKVLTSIFRSCPDTVAELLWARVSELVTSLLGQKPPDHESTHLQNLLLTLARFPVFCSTEHGVWVIMKSALKELNPLQACSLAYGILKLKKCPPDVCLQSVCALLHPLDYMLRNSAEDSRHPGFLDELVCDPAAVESLLSRRSSCVGLLCQCLSHVTDLCDTACLPAQIPHSYILSSIVSVLQFCIGQSVCTSPASSHLNRSLIGSLRVQRSALDAIGALSVFPMKQEDLETMFTVLTAYLENPETDPTVLKKAFQTSLKWLQASHASAEHKQYKHSFLQGLCPVLFKRLCSPCWEVRDSTLEFITHLMDGIKEHREFLHVLHTCGLLQLVLDLVKDPESYVRASAVTCVGQIASATQMVSSSILGNPFSVEAWKNEVLVPTLMTILCEDTEGFPRRAVVKVFSDWLRKGHMASFCDTELLLSQVLEVVQSDLDWEVKLNALELAQAYIAQIPDLSTCQSCPYTADLPSNKSVLPIEEAVVKCERVGLFQFVFSCLCDCDRPVALKACDILLSVKPAMCMGSSATTELRGRDWLEGTLKHRPTVAHASNCTSDLNITWVTDLLEKIDLNGMKSSLSRSSDYLHETPLSLLQDIRATVGAGEEQDADCY
ncbi:BRCA1-associated ATM activator 1 [Hyperolius riggenbachi]|uniref:BRCA1-associated ATM activator 1 n=1 Tax=Hyperolius riggenbachi TaxID=752182 RepID=UPI0035A3C919